MCKASKLLKQINTFCVAHGTHTWLMKNCLPPLTLFLIYWTKFRVLSINFVIVNTSLKQNFVRLTDQTNNDLLEIMNRASELLDANSPSSYVDSEDLKELNDENENDPLTYDSGNNQCSSASNYLISLNQTDPNRLRTLRKHNHARWNTILIMLRSCASKLFGIEVLLRQLKQFELMLSSAGNEMVNDSVQFLSVFESTTAILTASISYPTMS